VKVLKVVKVVAILVVLVLVPIASADQYCTPSNPCYFPPGYGGDCAYALAYDDDMCYQDFIATGDQQAYIECNRAARQTFFACLKDFTI
jgi:hypothetical protein